MSAYSHRRTNQPHQDLAASSPVLQQGRGMSNADRILQMNAAMEAASAPQYETQNDGRGPRAAYTTGRPYPGAAVTSELLRQDGRWGGRDILPHHSDRSNSWAANNIRNGKNRSLQAYDFTFENMDRSGRPVAGSAHGLALIVPTDVKVMDVQRTPAGSGRYGCFVVMEYIESGLRVSVHHLASVEQYVRPGSTLSGGTVFGRQGGSGDRYKQFPTHVDIVGTEDAVYQFVRSNQSGDFRTKKKANDQV